MPFLASAIRASELLLAERDAFGRALHLDDAALAGHDEIGVGAGAPNPRHSRGRCTGWPSKMPQEIAATWSLQHLRHTDHLPRLHPAQAVMQRDPAAGDRGGARAAVGLDHVAIDGDLLLAERLQVDHGAQRAADQPLDLQRAAALLARPRPRGACARRSSAAACRIRPSPSPCRSCASSPAPFPPGWPCTAHGCRRTSPGRSPRHAWRRRARRRSRAFRRAGVWMGAWSRSVFWSRFVAGL